VLVEPMPPDLLVWLVNEWGAVPRAAAGEEDRPYPDPAPLGAAGAGDLAEVAGRLHRIFAATDLTERVRLLATLLTDTGVRPALTLAGRVPSETWHVDDPRDALLAAAALTLRHQLAHHDPDRIGVCTGRNCADAYIDASPAGQRRFCSVTCQNRARVAAWRHQRKGQQRKGVAAQG
jgi:predicted RNA-binding Zn ribbon-like protein